MTDTIKVTDENFEKEVLEKSKSLPVIVDFWASWCGPCLILGPIMEEIAEEYKGKIIVAKMSVEENETQPMKYSIMSIPSVKMFKDGEVIDEFVGAIPKQSVKAWVEKHL